VREEQASRSTIKLQEHPTSRTRALSPAQRSMGRRTRGLLPVARHLLKTCQNESALVQTTIDKKKGSAKTQYDKHVSCNMPEPQIGDFVYVKPPPHRKTSPWAYGTVMEKPGMPSYIVDTPTGKIRRNRVHVRLAAPPPPDSWQAYSEAKQKRWRHRPPLTYIRGPPKVVDSVQPSLNVRSDESLGTPLPGVASNTTPSPKVAPTTTAKHDEQPLGRGGNSDQQSHNLQNRVVTRYGRTSKPVERMGLVKH
jgi:hypothetical protein